MSCHHASKKRNGKSDAERKAWLERIGRVMCHQHIAPGDIVRLARDPFVGSTLVGLCFESMFFLREIAENFAVITQRAETTGLTCPLDMVTRELRPIHLRSPTHDSDVLCPE